MDSCACSCGRLINKKRTLIITCPSAPARARACLSIEGYYNIGVFSNLVLYSYRALISLCDCVHTVVH